MRPDEERDLKGAEPATATVPVAAGQKATAGAAAYMSDDLSAYADAVARCQSDPVSPPGDHTEETQP